MKYSLALLDRAINRYLKAKMLTDETFFREHFIKKREKLYKLYNEPADSLFENVRQHFKLLECDLFNKIYSNYRVNNFRYLNDFFNNWEEEHNLIIARYSAEEIKCLLKDNEIKIVPGEAPGRFAADEWPCIDKFAFINTQLKFECFQEIKLGIRWKEFERKLTSESVSRDQKALPANPFPKIFKNERSYQIFLKLQALLVKKNTQVADYSFIFHKMFHDGLIFKITHKTFIDLANKKFAAGMSVDKLPYKNQNAHNKVYSTILSEFTA